VQQMDLADLASVRAAAAALQRLPRIDYLILNAGVMVNCVMQRRRHMARKRCSARSDHS
jgi:NAD(P)-dependent dehydrogenase (short-subunit alcohol dehydrogenase family)